MHTPPRTAAAYSLSASLPASAAERLTPAAPNTHHLLRLPLLDCTPDQELELDYSGPAPAYLAGFAACNGDSVPRLDATAASATTPARPPHSAPLLPPTANTDAEFPHNLRRAEPAVGFERCQAAPRFLGLQPFFWRHSGALFRSYN